MNFQHSAEQELLKDSVKAALARAGRERGTAALAELGVFGLTVEEEHGGSGLGMVEAAIVLQESGRAGLDYPVAETVLLAGGLVAEQPEAAEATLAGLTPVIAALSGQLSRLGPRLGGTLSFADPGGAKWLAATLDEDTIALLPATMANGATPRMAIEPGQQAFSLLVDIAASDAVIIDLPRHADCLAVLRCAELLGAAERCFDLAVAYIKDRSQFGQPIGANQALKHMAADSYLTLENIRVAVEYAAAAVDAARHVADETGLQEVAQTAVGVMLAYVPRAAREVAEASIQFHGGIGLTWEYALNRYLRRIVRIGTALGSVTTHRRALLDLMCAPRGERQVPASAVREWRTA